jgi:hypothetical protein
MGSHGGATGGQIEVLKNLGITEESVGAPILSSMELKKSVSKLRPQFLSTNTCVKRQDHCGNGSAHTDFGDIGGLIKMMVMAWGNRGPTAAMTNKHGFPTVLSEILL